MRQRQAVICGLLYRQRIGSNPGHLTGTPALRFDLFLVHRVTVATKMITRIDELLTRRYAQPRA